MIRYQLDIQPEPAEKKINYHDKLLMLGSCFSEHIAGRLSNLKFNVIPQPLGIVFNPDSLAKPFIQMFQGKTYTKKDLLFQNDIWYSKFHHGVFSDVDAGVLLELMNKTQADFEEGIKYAKFLFITLGSAWVYRLKEGGEIVANCHKIPQLNFTKELLDADMIVSIWTKILGQLKQLAPQLQVVLTVSPVKHLRDGVTENTVSKSMLLVAIHRLKLLYPDLTYFPAYELVNDDLRDYRFYEQDGAHPNGMAIHYVFDKFIGTYLDSDTMEYVKQMEKFNLLKSHRVSRQEGPEYEVYIKNLANIKQVILAKFGINAE